MRMQTQNEVQLYKSIKSLISDLHNPNDAALCFLWLIKIGEIEDKQTKYEYLQRFRDNILNTDLKYPFCESPPDGPLTKLMPIGELTSKPSTIPTEYQDLDTLILTTPGDDYLPRNEIEKYKERSRKYKQEIAKYQNILRSAFQSTPMKNKEADNLLPKSGQIGDRPHCPCEEIDLLANTPSGDNLAEINKKLANENEHLRKKCVSLENMVKKFNDSACEKKKNEKKFGKIINEKLEESFRVELKSIVDEKDKIICNLETKLNNETLNNNSSEILQTFEDKCQVLESRYQEMLNNVIEKHKKEANENRKRIEMLQTLLIEKKKIEK